MLIYFFFFIKIFFIKFIFSAKFGKLEEQCYKKNTWDDVHKSIKTVLQPTDCTKISKRCCYIKMSYYYGNIPIEATYCFHLTMNKEEFTQLMLNKINDEVLYYANWTGFNYDKYTEIGRNLNYNYTSLLNCYLGPKKKTEYSTYVQENCGKFENGKCVLINDKNYFTKFAKKFHDKYSSTYCNKKQEHKKCFLYDGARKNDYMIRPLLTQLVTSIHAENENYTYNQTDFNIEYDDVYIEVDDESTYKTEWDNGQECINFTKPIFTVVCPDNYDSISFIYLKWNIILLGMILILF